MRDKALALLRAHNKSEALVRHGIAVESVMRHFAVQAGEDTEYWGAVGLLHDVDYGEYPEEHCVKCVEILKDANYDDAFIRAVVSHGYGLASEVMPVHYMEKVLFTIDELTGLITAAAYMRPSKSVMDIEVSSVKKKFKDKAFAAGVNRDVIRKGCEMLGLELDDVISRCITGMRTQASELGL